MFSFQQIDDPVLDEIDQQDHLVDLHDHVHMERNINHQANKERIMHVDRSSLTNPSSSTTADHGVGDVKDDLTNKKLIHRETEKRRRKEMINLYASLRSLLPLEFIKGKRSTSDQMDQAVNYIKHMQENIKVLCDKRDQLKNSIGNDLFPNTVVVNSRNGGVEILINSCSVQDGFLFSRVLETLVEEGLNIISCISTRASDRLLHTIQSEANNHVSIDPLLLQQRLTGIANNRPSLN